MATLYDGEFKGGQYIGDRQALGYAGASRQPVMPRIAHFCLPFLKPEWWKDRRRACGIVLAQA